MRKVLARVLHGSHLFGTATERSDRDFISVVLPSAEDLLLARGLGHGSEGSTSDNSKRNTPDDIDEEQVPFHAFVSGLLNGNLKMIEVANAPDEAHQVVPHPIFEAARKSLTRFSNRDAAERMLSFCRAQAVVYSSASGRLDAAERALAYLERVVREAPPGAKAGDHLHAAAAHAASPHVLIESVDTGGGTRSPHLNVCGRRIAPYLPLADAPFALRKIVAGYRRRAVISDPSDRQRKDLAHALRIGRQASEYARTGRVTLPSPLAARYRAVRSGAITFADASRELEEVIRQVVADLRECRLPEVGDKAFAEMMILEAHAGQVAEWASRAASRVSSADPLNPGLEAFGVNAEAVPRHGSAGFRGETGRSN